MIKKNIIKITVFVQLQDINISEANSKLTALDCPFPFVRSTLAGEWRNKGERDMGVKLAGESFLLFTMLSHHMSPITYNMIFNRSSVSNGKPSFILTVCTV